MVRGARTGTVGACCARTAKDSCLPGLRDLPRLCGVDRGTGVEPGEATDSTMAFTLGTVLNDLDCLVREIAKVFWLPAIGCPSLNAIGFPAELDADSPASVPDINVPCN